MVREWSATRDECLRWNQAGFPFEEITCLYPSIGFTHLAFEKDYDPVPVRDWMMRNPWVPIVACVAYLVLIFGGQAYFQSRERWNWRVSLGAWNLFLAVFSFIGLTRMAPSLFHMYSVNTLEENFCFDAESSYGSGSGGLWLQLFILSKFPELIDTFFIVIHKKPLIFLHWYHHVSVLLYCWHSYVYKAPAGVLFCVMNYFVHSIMYFYYFLMAARLKPRWLKAHWITVAQITQMVVGVAATVYANYLFFVVKPDNCHTRKENNVAALIMYGSYLALFLQFFFGRYYFKSTKKHPTKEKET